MKIETKREVLGFVWSDDYDDEKGHVQYFVAKRGKVYNLLVLRRHMLKPDQESEMSLGEFFELLDRYYEKNPSGYLHWRQPANQVKEKVRRIVDHDKKVSFKRSRWWLAGISLFLLILSAATRNVVVLTIGLFSGVFLLALLTDELWKTLKDEWRKHHG